ncbi:methylphosphotriester-DNA--protein-cysteine methyltransferase family protein [Paenibacillus sp. S3N08]|uniref:Methylphosphotriester-DNA--protein-cysteine methyltransferase family protein n=2 Tax=Paenibacillus agricola TaxID=2716264 RepID=A0ABX0J6L5_9BACL|nr:methylphosphotriester-DNA--protein-cysteine methyltransferase family protein [Paenibacillus agricola]
MAKLFKPLETERLIGKPDEAVHLSISDKLTDEQWQAIIHNDAAYDGQFFYAVKTTNIFCRPSCKSRPPNKLNIGLFQTAEQALSANYRPCKRCKPTGQRLPDHEWVASVTAYIELNYMEHVTLNLLADISHGSPYHLHRTFKKVKGMTPVAYIQQIRIGHAQQQLISTKKGIAEIGQSVGLPNTPYFITLFKKKTGSTPGDYRQLQLQLIKEASENGQHP